MELSIVAKSEYVAGHGYEAIISLNGLVIWSDNEIFNNHMKAELIANDKLLEVFKKLFNE